jgi:hypothetical protein
MTDKNGQLMFADDFHQKTLFKELRERRSTKRSGNQYGCFSICNPS